MSFYDLFVAQADRTARIEAQRDNAARLGFSQHRIQSTGFGSVRRTSPIRFSVAFLEEPFFTQGATLVSRDEELESDPFGVSGVYQWDRNPKGHYIGAYVYLNVVTGDFLSGSGSVRMIHNLLFQGMAYKDLGPSVSTEAQLITPRSSGFGA